MKNSAMEVGLTLKLELEVFKQGDFYIAYSRPLDLSAYGKSEQDAIADFKETLDLFFEEIIKKGTLGEVLKNLGWKKRPISKSANSQHKSTDESRIYKNLVTTTLQQYSVPIYS